MLAISNWFLFPIITLFVAVCFLLIMIVLIQKGRGGGLAGAFGGAGGNTAFGAKTGDVLTWVTSILFGVFVLLAIILNLMTQSGNPPKAIGNVTSNTPLQNPAPAK
jgi:preprotein translocase subunit SecG